MEKGKRGSTWGTLISAKDLLLDRELLISFGQAFQTIPNFVQRQLIWSHFPWNNKYFCWKIFVVLSRQNFHFFAINISLKDSTKCFKNIFSVFLNIHCWRKFHYIATIATSPYSFNINLQQYKIWCCLKYYTLRS